MNPQVSLLLRNFGSALAGALILKGWVSEGFKEDVIGIVVLAGTILWSQWKQRQHAAEVKEALFTEPPRGISQI